MKQGPINGCQAPWLFQEVDRRWRGYEDWHDCSGFHVGKKKIPQKMIPWIEAKKRHRLTDVQVQMARELGMNPKKNSGSSIITSKSRGNSLFLNSSNVFTSKGSNGLGRRVVRRG